MKKGYICISYFLCILVHSSPWIFESDVDLKEIKNELSISCGARYHFISNHSQSIESIYHKIKTQIDNELNQSCINSLEKLEKLILNNFLKNKIDFGYNTKIDNLYLQERGERYPHKESLYIQNSQVIDRFFYKIKVSKNREGYNFDGSELSYFINKNAVIRLGSYNRWWSPSDNTSLIFSNTARPIPTIGIQSYNSIPFKNSLLKFFGTYNYEFFIGRLEKNREIPNTLLFGNRFSFSPNDFINISLLRVAQFGGKGRIINSHTIKNMILGKDTSNSNLDFLEQPGNQIAGIDFSIHIPAKIGTTIYAQYLGEDGLDPIIDDRWIGAIFPSKRFGMAGVTFQDNTKLNAWKYTIEHVNTDTGYRNVTYNHSLYKTGYRHKGKPIGAAIDTDSHNTIFSMDKYFNKRFIKIKYEDMKINQNKSIYSQWGENSFDNKQITIKLSQKFKEKIQLDLILIHRKTKNDDFDKNSVFLKFNKSF